MECENKDECGCCINPNGIYYNSGVDCDCSSLSECPCYNSVELQEDEP